MTYDEAELEAAWHDNVEAIAAYAVTGLTAFGVVGDPNVFSTFSHVSKMLRRRMPAHRRRNRAWRQFNYRFVLSV